MFEIYIEDSQLDKEHIVECIMGKKIANNEVEYAVRWSEFSETTWEPLSSFNYQSEYLIKRFERCQAYNYYWSQLTSEKQQQGKRVHIIGNLIQVQQKLIKQKEIFVDNYRKRQEYFETNNYLFDDDLIIKKNGVRGRPKLNMNCISQDCSEYIQDHMRDENQRRGKFEKDVIFEIIQFERAKEAEKLPSNFITEMIQNTRAIQQELLEQQQSENLRIYHKSTIYETQQEHQFIFYDLDLKQITVDFDTNVEYIICHQLIKNKLLFKCEITNKEVYGTYEVLTSKCPTLLVDYLIENAILV
ncbi:hypothetical protein pb186bvf_001044 [Paramecium bursaria]